MSRNDPLPKFLVDKILDAFQKSSSSAENAGPDSFDPFAIHNMSASMSGQMSPAQKAKREEDARQMTAQALLKSGAVVIEVKPFRK